MGSPAFIHNPKLHAKILIVVVLTVNGLFVERCALKLIRNRENAPLFSNCSTSQQRTFFVIGSISAASWYFAFGFGVFSELNFAFDFWTLLLAYIAGTALIYLGLRGLKAALYDWQIASRIRMPLVWRIAPVAQQAALRTIIFPIFLFVSTLPAMSFTDWDGLWTGRWDGTGQRSTLEISDGAVTHYNHPDDACVVTSAYLQPQDRTLVLVIQPYDTNVRIFFAADGRVEGRYENDMGTVGRIAMQRAGGRGEITGGCLLDKVELLAAPQRRLVGR
jgi:uncharacterized membrane protein